MSGKDYNFSANTGYSTSNGREFFIRNIGSQVSTSAKFLEAFSFRESLGPLTADCRGSPNGFRESLDPLQLIVEDPPMVLGSPWTPYS